MGVKYDNLKVVKAERDSYRFRVRVVRKWYVPGFLNPDQSMSMEVIFMDEEGKVTKMIVLQLADPVAKIECTLFGDFVSQVKSFFSDGNRVSPMIVLQYAKVKLYKGKAVVQNTLYASRLLINPDVPEVVEIKRRISSSGVIVDAMCDSFGAKTHTSIEDEFLKLYPKKSIAELMENPEDGVVVLLGTVNEIVNNGNWWYPSCKCLKAVFTDNGVYYCSACSRHVFNVVPRYKVTIDVSDGTGTAWLILFDYDVTYLVKKNCSDLLSSFTEGTDDLEYPLDLKSIVGRRMLFKVSNTYSSSDHDTCVFKVRGLCDDPNIIAMYDLEGADNAPLDISFSFGIPVACSAPVVDLSLDGKNFSEDSNRLASSVVDPYLPHANDASVIGNSAQESDGFATPVMNKRKSEYSMGEVSYNSANRKKKSFKLSKK
ncbi:hypothetical protein RIF29_09789 [Crotalaria pallida]|uniref:Replication factor A C-terminal domain-containing protein n=1 Tax=Crotalaria pallida TaxID=3830 RepID=A0AAN9IJL4_CROPI